MTEQQFAPAPPGQEGEPCELYQLCHRAKHYPTDTFTFPDGSLVIYHNPAEAWADLWARSMLQEAQALGGVVVGEE